MGNINVKSSLLHVGVRNRQCWKFRKKINAFIPDHYICIGFSTDRSIIEHVWIIPGDSNLLAKSGINISHTKLNRALEYEVDSNPYNEIYQNLEIKQLHEFKNTDE